MKTLLLSFVFLSLCGGVSFAAQEESLLNKPAPKFELKNHEGKLIKLENRTHKGWIVLYFYPKADTPGCTKQACAFRDNIKVIQKLNTEVFGISVNSVEDQKKFHEKYHLTFDLLADEEGKVTRLFGVKMAVVNMAKRWTFVLDPELKVRKIFEDVDPVLDAQNVAKTLIELQK